MTDSLKVILESFSNRITKFGHSVDGLDLSYVDIQAKHLEIFTYSTKNYENAVLKGLTDKDIGSLLLSNETFIKGTTIKYESKYLNIPNSISENSCNHLPTFKRFSTSFSGKSNATHQKWINHYKKHKINGVYFFVGRRRENDFDLVLFGVVNGFNKKKIKKDLRLTIKEFLNELNDFAIVFETLRKQKDDIELHATKAAISRIIISNTAHHLTSHCAPYCTTDKVIERLGKKIENINGKDLRSVINMVNLYVRYVNAREEFVAGLNENTQPVAMRFYKDIIQPLAENSLFLDTIAASEGITWSKQEIGKIINDVNGTSRLRFRVFYHCNLFNKQSWGNGKTCSKGIENTSPKECPNNCENKNSDCEIGEEIYLEEPGCYREMVAHYKCFDEYGQSNIKTKNYCIHNLPYFRHQNQDSFHDGEAEHTCDDIEILVRGTQGAHSIYSILENYIRNTAKHASENTLKNIFHLDVIIKLKKDIENPADTICMELTTNIPTFKKVFTEEDANKIENKVSPYSKLLIDSKKGIDSDTIQRGIADIKINGVFLKMQDITQKNLENAIKLGHYPKTDSGQYSIAYKFKLKKPQKIAFVGDFNKPEHYISEFGTFGIRFFNDLSKELYYFQFVVFASAFFIEHIKTILENTNDKKNEWLYRLPRRVIIYCDSDDQKNQLNNTIKYYQINIKRFLITDINPIKENCKTTLVNCWKIWLKRWLNDNDKIYLKVIPDQTNGKNIFGNLSNDIFSQDYSAKKKISFLRHEATIDADKLKKANWLKDYWFFESIEKNNKDFNIINGYKELRGYGPTPFDLSETGLLKLLIFDERLIDSLGNKDFTFPSKDHFPFYGLCKNSDNEFKRNYRRDFMDTAIAANIFMVTQINGSPIKSIKTNRNCNFKFVDGSIKIETTDEENNFINIESFDVLIIHRSQLIKLLDDKSEDNFKIIKECFPMIYISTGGGSIGDIENMLDFKFGLISLNQLLAHFTQTIMKQSFKSFIS